MHWMRAGLLRHRAGRAGAPLPGIPPLTRDVDPRHGGGRGHVARRLNAAVPATGCPMGAPDDGAARAPSRRRAASEACTTAPVMAASLGFELRPPALRFAAAVIPARARVPPAWSLRPGAHDFPTPSSRLVSRILIRCRSPGARRQAGQARRPRLLAYLREEQRRQPGCPAREFDDGLRICDTRLPHARATSRSGPRPARPRLLSARARAAVSCPPRRRASAGPWSGRARRRTASLVASTSARRRGARLGVVACLSAGLVAFAGGRLRAQAASPPAGASSLPAQEPLSALPGESAFPLQVTGFGVADYRADGRTKDNSFEAGKLAVSLFRELTDHVWVFGKITTSVSVPPPPRRTGRAR